MAIKIDLEYDANTDTYKVKGGNRRDPIVGPLVGKSFTKEQIRAIASVQYNTKDKTGIARVSLDDLRGVTPIETPKDKTWQTSAEIAAEIEKEKLPPQEYSYRTGRLVGQKDIDDFVQQNPITRQVYFITADAPGADIYGGTAEGGTPSPTFAVILPSLISDTSRDKSESIVYDSSVVEEFFINDLIKNNRVSEFKQLLAEKGFYTLAGIQNFETQSSLRQGATADEFFGIALNRYLSELSQQNYQNVKDGLSSFGIDDYIKNVQQDMDALSAYVPSDREAEAVLKSTYSQYVGRMPSAEEIQAFKFALEAEATANPRRSAVDMVTGMETTYEGFTADQLESFATEYTLDRPEAEEFGAGQGGLNAISNVFERIANKARQEVQSVVRPGSL
jgi:hypothetical protein